MNARNRVFIILGVLTVGSLIWYLLTTRRSSDLQLIGTVDANEVIVSSKIPGRIQTLTVEEGQDVKAGELIATIESDDLAEAHKGRRSHCGKRCPEVARGTGDGASEPGRDLQRNAGCRGAGKGRAGHSWRRRRLISRTSRPTPAARLLWRSRELTSTQATRRSGHQPAGCRGRGEYGARDNLDAAQASLRQARAHELLTQVNASNVDETRDAEANAKFLADEAKVEAGLFAGRSRPSTEKWTCGRRGRVKWSRWASRSSPSWTFRKPGSTRRCRRRRPTACSLATRCAS